MSGYGKKHCQHCKPEKPCQQCLPVNHAREYELHRQHENAGRQMAQEAAAAICHDNAMMKKDPSHASSYEQDKEIATDLLVAAGAYAANEHRHKEEELKHMKRRC